MSAPSHHPETVTVLNGRCATENCDHSDVPGDDCRWEDIQVCTACSYDGVDVANVDAVAVTPWPCAEAGEVAV